MSDLIFASGNTHKYDEARAILAPFGVNLRLRKCDIEELQTTDIHRLTSAKCREAYSIVGRPLFVEHTSLQNLAYGGFPGGLTSIFLETVGLTGACELLGRPGANQARAVTVIGYTNGSSVELFEGSIDGEILKAPTVADTDWKKFGWNAIFRPATYKESLAQLGPAEKNRISMRKVALEKLMARIQP